MKRYISMSMVALLVLAGLLAGTVAAGPQEEQTQEATPAPSPAIAPEEIAAVQQIYQTMDAEQRLSLSEQFLAQYPESPLRGRVYAAAAMAYRMMNSFDKAIEYGQQALEVNPRDPINLILLADAFAESARPSQADFEQRLNRAEAHARRALEILPEMFAAQKRRPEVPEEEYERQRKYVEAQPHATLGFVYLRREQYAEAEQELKQAIELNQLRPNAFDYLRLGVAQRQQQQYEEASASFQRCAELGTGLTETCQKLLDQVQERLKDRPTLREGPSQR